MQYTVTINSIKARKLTEIFSELVPSAGENTINTEQFSSLKQSRNLATQQSRNLATQQSRNLATQPRMQLNCSALIVGERSSVLVGKRFCKKNKVVADRGRIYIKGYYILS
jgi:hypothetical protein